MTQRTLKRYRIVRRIGILMAAAPLFQLSQCSTGVSQVFQTAANNAPATIFSVLNNIGLLPLRLLISGGDLTGGQGFFF